MSFETGSCECFVLGAGSSPIGVGVDTDAASWREESCYLYILGIHHFYQVFHYYVDTVFVKVSVVTETEKVEFETLALDHSYVRNV